MKIKYQEAHLDDVMRLYIDQYKLPPNTHLHSWEWAWNTDSKTVIFKMFVADGPDPLKP